MAALGADMGSLVFPAVAEVTVPMAVIGSKDIPSGSNSKSVEISVGCSELGKLSSASRTNQRPALRCRFRNKVRDKGHIL